MFPSFVIHQITQRQPSQKQQQHALLIRKPPVKKQGVELMPGTQKILLSSFVWLILGKPGSGKSHFINQLLDQPNFYNKRFDRILYLGPTRYPSVIHDNYNTSLGMDIGFIQKRLGQCKQWAQNVLIILDDVISQIGAPMKARLQQLFFNRRHILKSGCISFILTSQKYTAIPTWIRGTTNAITLFMLSNPQLLSVFKEVPLISTSTNKLLSYYGTMGRHGFLYLNLEQGKAFDNSFEIIN